MKSNTFCTAINCMDGRAQKPVFEFLEDYFDVPYVDMITEPGPDGILARRENHQLIDSIFSRVQISLEKHNSVGIALVAHYDCAGNPVDKDTHIEHLKNAVNFLKEKYSNVEIIGLWLDETFKVSKIM